MMLRNIMVEVALTKDQQVMTDKKEGMTLKDSKDLYMKVSEFVDIQKKKHA